MGSAENDVRHIPSSGGLGSLGVWTVSLCGETVSASKRGMGRLFEPVALQLLLGLQGRADKVYK